MKMIIKGQENFDINYLVLVAGTGTFLFTMLFIYSYQNIPDVEVNPFFY